MPCSFLPTYAWNFAGSWLKPYPLQHKFLKYMHSWERWHISFFNRKSCTKSFFSTEKFVMIDCPSAPWKPKVWNKKAFKSFKGLLAQFNSVQPLSHVRLFATPRTAKHARPSCPSPTPRAYATHVHWVGDAIQPSHPLSSPSPPAFSLSQHQDLFKWVSSWH